MRLPSPDSPASDRVRYGRYLARRLRRDKRNTLAADVESSNSLVLQRAREREDATVPVIDARADRDAADDELDDIAKNARAHLAGRGKDAYTKAPYTNIFPEGIEYYTAAPLDQETKRYGELINRLIENLPQDDEVRKSAVPAITAGIASFKTASEAVEQALTAESIARTRLEVAEEAWGKLMIKAYGVLFAELGRSAAGRFFPKPRSVKKDKADKPE